MDGDKRVDARAEIVDGRDLTRAVSAWTRRVIDMELGDSPDGEFRSALDQRNKPQWPGFVREVFGSLYGLGVSELPDAERAVGSEWVGEILRQAAELPEWQDLCRRSEGDPWRCGLSVGNVVTAMASDLAEMLDKLPNEDPQAAAEQAQQAAEQAQQAQAAAEQAAEGDDVGAARKAQQAAEQAQQASEQAQQASERVARKAADVAEKLQQGAATVRSVLRDAANDAQDEMDEMDEALRGVSPGSGEGVLTSVKAPDRKVVEVLRANPKLAAAGRVAGRLRVTARAGQHGKHRGGREEICDVTSGSDLERLLPSELALLADEDAELLLMRKLTEGNALQYEMRGRVELAQGPIVVAIDGSYSMHGHRHEWAMGVAIALLEVAGMQRRPFAVVHFDTQVQHHTVIENARSVSLDALAEMVGFFSGGGTRVQEAVRWVGENLFGGAHKALQGGDLVLVTDGESGSFAEEVERLREEYGAGTYGVAIDHGWAEVNQEPLAAYSHVTDGDIAGGGAGDKIKEVLSL